MKLLPDSKETETQNSDQLHNLMELKRGRQFLFNLSKKVPPSKASIRPRFPVLLGLLALAALHWLSRKSQNVDLTLLNLEQVSTPEKSIMLPPRSFGA